MWIVLLAAASVLFIAPWVVLFWLHNRGGVRRLRLPLHRWRRVSMRLGAAAAIIASFALTWRAETSQIVAAAPLVAVSLLALIYSRLFQLLVPRPAPLLVPQEGAVLAPDDLVAVLAEGNAVPLSWLTRTHTARRHETVLIHGTAPRTLLAVHSPDYLPIAAVLPHPGGFEIGAMGRLWDGATGRALDGKADLARLPVGLCSHAAWRQAHPRCALLGPAQGLPTSPLPDTILLPLRGLGEADNRWGVVLEGRWRPLATGSLATCPELSGDRFYLAERAARERQITGS